jgi:hypothetical protein
MVAAGPPELRVGEFTVTVGAVFTIKVLEPFAVHPPLAVIITE